MKTFHTTRLMTTALILGIFASAMAMTAYGKVFNDKYHVKDGSTLAEAKCGVCHVKANGGKLDAYGKDIQVAMKAEGAKKLTPAILTKVESLDSDKDGKKNLAEITSDSNPGK